ncbi:MAG: hypothetical protein EOP53_07420 [Sphingobacteriales bacterium]|nr:MAG: hypothetical protein EOP53_07420 [Sphingobacteriales bacterium]
MKLHENWLTDGIIDFEYKKYLLLGYLQSVEKDFTGNKLYPSLAELITHYQNLENFIQRKHETQNAFPKDLQQIDLQNFFLRYKKVVEDDEMMAEIEKILSFSVPKIKKSLEEGREIYEWIEEKLHLWPLGIVPLQQQAGFLFIRNGEKDKETKVYQYQLSFLQQANDTYRAIQTQYISTFTASITNTYESMKHQVIKSQKLLIAPAVYVVESELQFPLTETLLPIAKRTLVRHLTKEGF